MSLLRTYLAKQLVPSFSKPCLTRTLATTSFNLNKPTISSSLNQENYPDLSKYDPILDFPGCKVAPGGNPHWKGKNQQMTFPSTPPPKESIIDESEDVTYSHELGISEELFKKLRKKVLVVRRTVNMTSGGKIPSMTVLVVVGNGAGSGGYGEAKNENVGKAVKKATQRAIKNMISFNRYDKRTIYHDVEFKFKATQLKLFARPPGFGVRTNLYIHEICKCIGVSDLGAKVYGSLSPMNVIKAFFEALQKQRTPEDIAKARGKKLIDVQFQYYGVS